MEGEIAGQNYRLQMFLGAVQRVLPVLAFLLHRRSTGLLLLQSAPSTELAAAAVWNKYRTLAIRLRRPW
jgi:hypothetical protein